MGASARAHPTWALIAGSVPVRVAVLGLLLVLAFGASLRASVAWDDAIALSANPAVRSLAAPWRFFTDPRTMDATGTLPGAQYRPLRTLGWALQFAVFRGNAWGYHLVSMLLHACGAWLVGRLTRRLFGGGAWLAATVWLLHPALAENVLYLAAQGNLMCVALLALALDLHLRWLHSRRVWNLAASLGAGLGAMLAYEHGLLLPVLIGLVELFRLARRQTIRVPPVARHAPYWMLAAGFWLWRSAIVEAVPTPPWWGGSWIASLGLQLRLWLEGWRLTVLPVGQLVRYLPPDAPSWAPLGLAVTAHLAVAAAVVAALVRRRHLVVAACLLWWYVAQLPTSNLVVANLGYMFAPRFLFLALLLPVAAVASAAKPRLQHSRTAVVLLALLLTAAVGLDRRQAEVWQNSRSVAVSLVAHNEVDFGGHFMLGFSYLLEGRPADARRHLATAGAIDASWPPVSFLLGEAHLRLEDLPTAAAYYAETLRLQPVNEPARLRLAEVGLLIGDRAMASEWQQAASDLSQLGGDLKAGYSLVLGHIAVGLGSCAGVPELVDQALAASPGAADVLAHSGNLLLCCGDRQRGLGLVREAADRTRDEWLDRVGDQAWVDIAAIQPIIPPRRPFR
ncbi:MAG: glycosyltransferase family 39 protein [Thermoanaerobaculaceae bacterium]|nr:glycosyltransferase family 39 protein [Thermoanaerobaculaceae bacterium]MDI9621090.1 hypothetical protein [Acidobacteriota bacterium]NLH09910.1 hypothetical protein [Holophagae bacterium]HPW55525.1 hypothetical protein [Thermoanaerobaculaceae bacterium]